MWATLGRHRYLILGSVLFVLMAIHTANQHWSQDFWAHAAAVRELASHPFEPAHPQLDLEAPHHFFTAYAFVVAAVSGLFNTHAVTTLAVFALLNLILAVAGLSAFTRQALGRPKAGFYALLLTLVFWGGRPWRYSGFLHLNALGFELPLPSTFSAGLTLLSLAGFHTYLRSGSPFRLVWVVVATALVVASHPLTALFLAVGLLALVLGGWNANRGRALWGLLAVGGGSLLTVVAWPYFSLFDLVFAEAGLFDASNRVMYEGPLLRIWPALLGVPLLWRRWRVDRRDVLVWTFIGLGVIYAYGGVSRAWTYGRVMPGLVLVLHLAIADRLAGLEERGRIPRAGYVGLAGLLAVTSFSILPGLVRAVPEPLLPVAIRADPRLQTTAARYRFLADEVGQYDTVLAGLATAWPVPAYGGKVVATGGPQPFVADIEQRRAAVSRFFSSSASQSQRLATITAYDVEYLLVDSTEVSAATREQLEGLGVVEAREGGLLLIKVGEGQGQ